MYKIFIAAKCNLGTGRNQRWLLVDFCRDWRACFAGLLAAVVFGCLSQRPRAHRPRVSNCPRSTESVVGARTLSSSPQRPGVAGLSSPLRIQAFVQRTSDQNRSFADPAANARADSLAPLQHQGREEDRGRCSTFARWFRLLCAAEKAG